MSDAERWAPERDLLAEKILLAWHTVEWHIDNATKKEWEMAVLALAAPRFERTGRPAKRED